MRTTNLHVTIKNNLSVVFLTTKSETHKGLKDYRNDPIRNTVMFLM